MTVFKNFCSTSDHSIKIVKWYITTTDIVNFRDAKLSRNKRHPPQINKVTGRQREGRTKVNIHTNEKYILEGKKHKITESRSIHCMNKTCLVDALISE